MSTALQEAHAALIAERTIVVERLLAVDVAIDAVARLVNDTPSKAPAGDDQPPPAELTPATDTPEAKPAERPAATGGPFVCPECKEAFASKQARGAHIGRKHKVPLRPAALDDADADLRACPDCGQKCRNLGAHRFRAHGVRAGGSGPAALASVKEVAPPAAPLPEVEDHAAGLERVPASSPALIADGVLALRCEECPAAFPLTDRAKLTAHCVKEHRRDARPSERVPCRADQVGA